MPEYARASAGSQDYVDDPRNDSAIVSVNGVLTPRVEASVSVFDSGFVLGDGVWEGLRLVGGRIAFLNRHLDRLWDGAKMLRIDLGVSRETLKTRLFDVIDANAFLRLARERPRKSLNRSQDDTATALRPIIGHATS